MIYRLAYIDNLTNRLGTRSAAIILENISYLANVSYLLTNEYEFESYPISNARAPSLAFSASYNLTMLSNSDIHIRAPFGVLVNIFLCEKRSDENQMCKATHIRLLLASTQLSIKIKAAKRVRGSGQERRRLQQPQWTIN
jgi:hypothetical protein